VSLTNVYQYHNNSGGLLRYFYTTLSSLDGKSWNSPPKDDLKHWVNDGIAFIGSDSSDSNAVPVYQFYANVKPSSSDDAKKYFFTLNQTQAGDGWYQSSNTPAFYVYESPDAGLLEFTMWYDAQPQYTFFIGNSSQTGALAPPPGWGAVGWGIGPGQGTQPFYALPGVASLAYTYQSLSLSNVTLPDGNPNVMDTQTLKNTSSTASITQTVSYTTGNTGTVTLALTETIGESSTVKLTFGLPGVADGEGSTTTSLDLSSTQTVSEQVNQSITVSGSVTLPPNGSVKVTAIMYVAPDISIPFSLQCLVTAQVANQNAGSPSNGPCTLLTDLFRQKNPNFNGSIVAAPSLNGITVSMAGNMTGSWAVNTDLSVADNPPAQSSAAGGQGTLSGMTKQISVVRGAQAAKGA
jgi:hypothetical protein